MTSGKIFITPATGLKGKTVFKLVCSITTNDKMKNYGINYFSILDMKCVGAFRFYDIVFVCF